MALDNATFDLMADRLYVAVISDILDGLGFRDQVMQAGIVPVQREMPLPLVGRAATVLVGPQFEVVEQPYTNQISAIDALQPGDVVVSAVGGMKDIAVWGELFSNAAMARGAPARARSRNSGGSRRLSASSAANSSATMRLALALIRTTR